MLDRTRRRTAQPYPTRTPRASAVEARCRRASTPFVSPTVKACRTDARRVRPMAAGATSVATARIESLRTQPPAAGYGAVHEQDGDARERADRPRVQEVTHRLRRRRHAGRRAQRALAEGWLGVEVMKRDDVELWAHVDGERRLPLPVVVPLEQITEGAPARVVRRHCDRGPGMLVIPRTPVPRVSVEERHQENELPGALVAVERALRVREPHDAEGGEEPVEARVE